jgi:hypothetical protein
MAALILLILPAYSADQPVTVIDSLCITTTQFQICGGTGGHGCASITFFEEHTGSFTLTASIDNCGGQHCTGCVSEAYIYEGNNCIVCIHSACCDAQSTGVNLVSGHTYTLYVCLLPCSDDINRTAAGANCPARATITL